MKGKLSFPSSVVYTEAGTIGGYSAGRFILDLSHLTLEVMEQDTEYQIPCTWRFKIEEVPEWPEC